MSKHTPGPWLLSGNTIYALMHAGRRKGDEQFKNRFSAYVQADRECPDDEHEANARLIATAPELLEALKACVLWMDTNYERSEAAHRAARAAIAKAEGKQ